MNYFLFLTRHTVNCRRQAEIKAKSTVQTPFFEKSAEMQLLNSNIPRRARTTKYSNKKAQDLQNLVLFCCVAFSYYKDGADNRGRTCTGLPMDPKSIASANSAISAFIYSFPLRLSYPRPTKIFRRARFVKVFVKVFL